MAAAAELKRNPPQKPKKSKKQLEEEELEDALPKPPKGERMSESVLRMPIRSNNTEVKFGMLSELDHMRRSLSDQGVSISSDVLAKALLMPDTEELPDGYNSLKGELIGAYLFKNPYPKEKKKGKKKKKKS